MRKGFFTGTAAKGETAVFSTSTRDEVEKIIKTLESHGICTTLDAIELQCRKHANEPLTYTIKENATETKTYEEIRYMGECLARSIEEHELCPKIEADGKKMKVLGILIHNCWMAPVAIISGFYSNCTGVFIYTDPPDHYYYNMNKGLFDTLFLSTPMIDPFLKALERKEIRVIKNVILDSEAPAEAVKELKNYGIVIYYLNDLIEKGKKSTAKLERHTTESDIYVVSTSGSTGYPKGAVLGHGPVFYNSMVQCGPWQEYLNDRPYMLNNVTLGFGTVLGFNTLLLCRGGRLVYIEKKCSNFLEEIRVGNPSFLLLSPLAYNKMYQGIQQAINGLPREKKEGLLKVLDMKTRYYRVTGKYAHPAFDKHLELFREKLFGNRLKLFMNVGAAINEEVLTFFRVLTSTRFINLYGSCEMGGACTVANDTDPVELIGTPVPWYEFKLVDVPDKCYFVTDMIDGKPCPRGEVYVRGPIMNRYLNEPKKTSETIDSEGWLRTGDVAILREGCVLQIIDRKNNVIKLTCVTGGATSKYVSQLAVYAENNKDYAVGIVVPSSEALLEVAKEKGLPQDIKALCESEEIEKVILEDFKRIGSDKQVLYFEYIPRVILVAEPFTQSNGLVTATFKVRRSEVAKKYADRIETVYKEKKVNWIH